jgi:hypothetical protein
MVILVILVPFNNLLYFYLLSKICINVYNEQVVTVTSEVGRQILLVKELFEVVSFFEPQTSERKSSSLK